MKIETIAVRAGHSIDPGTGAVASPIHLSTTFERDVEGSYSRGFMYTRNNNPNRQALEQGISALEGGAAAAAFATGTGAASVLGALGAFSNPTVNVTNPNQQIGTVGGLTAATVITNADAITIGAGAHAETFTASAASTVGALLTAINTDTTGGNITVGGTSNGVRAFLDSTGHLNITDPGNNNAYTFYDSTGNEADDKCAWHNLYQMTRTAGLNFWVQPEYSNGGTVASAVYPGPGCIVP